MGAKREFPPFSSSSSSSFFKYKEFWLSHITSKCFGRSGDCDIVLGERHPQGGGVIKENTAQVRSDMVGTED